MRYKSAVLLFMLLFIGCSIIPKKRVCEGDFTESVTQEQIERVPQEIDELEDSLQAGSRNADFYRQLAVYYRMAGTPRSRLLSVEAIDRAIELSPMEPKNYVEKGLTMLSRRFVGEARGCFEQAIELDPDCFDAWHHLGRIEEEEYKKTTCFPEYLQRAIHYYQKAYSIRHDDKRTLYRLGLLHLLRHMPRTAGRYAEKALKYDSGNPKVHLLIGTIHLSEKDFDGANRAFTEAIELMSDEEKAPFFDVSPILPTDERELFLCSTEEKKLKWIHTFWLQNDPTPSTQINERLLEHYRRVYLAGELLDNDRLDLKGPGTHRGRALICYGLPHKKYYDLGSGECASLIVWGYEFGNISFNLYFQDEFLNGNYHFPIELHELGEVSAAIMNNIPQSYEYPIRYTPLPLWVEHAQFRAEGENTRFELSAALPDSSCRLHGDSWIASFTLFDSEWNRLSSSTVPFKPDTLLHVRKRDTGFAVYNLCVDLFPRPLGYILVMEIVNEAHRYRGMWKQPLEVRNLHGRSLKISSIKFIARDEHGAHTAVLNPIPVYRHEEALELYYELYNLKRGGDNLARYRLTYAIKARKEEPAGIRKTLSCMLSSVTGNKPQEAPYVSSTIEQSINRSTVADRLEIDLRTLESGTYVLILQVDDLETGSSASQERTFTVSQ